MYLDLSAYASYTRPIKYVAIYETVFQPTFLSLMKLKRLKRDYHAVHVFLPAFEPVV
jgi:hypothetical protein